MPLSQATCCWQRLPHAVVEPTPPHTWGVPLLPQGLPSGQAAPQSRVPPQPLPIVPQSAPPPSGMQEIGFSQPAPDAPHKLGVPAPPQVSPSGQGSLQSSDPSQPSPIIP